MWATLTRRWQWRTTPSTALPRRVLVATSMPRWMLPAASRAVSATSTRRRSTTNRRCRSAASRARAGAASAARPPGGVHRAEVDLRPERRAPLPALGGLTDDQQAVLLHVPQPEHRRDRPTHAADLGVDVDAGGLELFVERLDVRRVERDARLPIARDLRLVSRRGCQRDGRLTVAQPDLDPAVLAAERDVDPLLEPELRVELDRPVLVRNRDHDIG